MKLIDVTVQRKVLEDKLQNCWLQNIYDGNDENSKIIIFKFNTSPKTYLLVESGKRIHTIETFTSLRPMPSWFCAKLRKHFKNQRLISIEQFGADRVLNLKMANNEHIIIELYDKGNFIITDCDYIIISSARKKPYEIMGNEVKIGCKYPVEIFENEPLIITSTKGYMIKDKNYSPEIFEKAQEFETLDDAMKEYYNCRINVENKTKKKKKITKEEKIKKNITNQIQDLSKKEENAFELAVNFEENVDSLQNLIDFINSQIQYKIAYEEIQLKLCKLMPLYKNIKLNHIMLKLDNIEIDYRKSAYENVNIFYQKKKTLCRKKMRATEVLENVSIIPKENNEKKELFKVERKHNKFENFWWFYSEGFIILVGKSADDNEIILNNVEKDDILVHGDFDKSPWGVIKNPDKKIIPMKIINQAAEQIVYRSWNWESNITNNAYYTTPNKISKTAPSGEYMGKGSRMVHEKNYLSNANMEMGVGIIFKTNNNFFSEIKTDTEINYAMVMCGPYSIFKDYTYKIKIKPSGLSNDKGRKKLIDNIIQKFLKNKKGNVKEKKYIRIIPKEEWDKVIIRKIKLF